MDITDKSLIDAHIRGERDAFGELVRRHGPGVLGYLTKMTSNKEKAEDYFQETFKRIHEKAHTLRGNFKPWLYTIATNVAINDMRKEKRRNTVSLNVQADCVDGNCGEMGAVLASKEAVDPSEHALKNELTAQVRRAIELLPDKQRITLILSYYQQLSYSEVAAVLNCSVGTVKTQMFRALRTLAGKLPDVSGVLE